MKIRLALVALTMSALITFGWAQQPSTDTQSQPAATTAPVQTQSGSDSNSQQTQTPAATQPTLAPQQDQQQSDATQEKAPPPLPEPKDPKVKKGSKDDVDAIGNRDMGKRGMGNWYSLESEIRMGKQYAMMVEQSSKLVTDPVVNEYVNRIGQNLVRNSDAKVPFTIKVIDSDEVNAFALPGGFFFVNSGLILAADEEAELAGVMAHEIAHVCARHATRQMTKSNWVNIGTIPLIFVGGGIGYAVRSAAGLGLPMTFLAFSRADEAEADYLGVQYMYRTGYDPQAYVAFFEKLQAQEKKKPGSLAKAFATHPQTPDRIENSQKEIAKILPARDTYVVSTSEFDDVKARLAAIENRRKPQDEKASPSLRRASSDGNNPNSNDKSGDDRPTLKRRDD
ncbi:MAG TPA: M48 family metallopeptidase [Candidatus Acidoferrales bacterium]|nr:M48 family metallopeptidase [Candidatus Acidoferrales bacterium]